MSITAIWCVFFGMERFVPRVGTTEPLTSDRYFSVLATRKIVPLDNPKSRSYRSVLLTRSHGSPEPLPLESKYKCDSLHVFTKTMFMFANLTAASLSSTFAQRFTAYYNHRGCPIAFI
jgi:hypothetical protein